MQFAFFQDKRVRALRRKHGDLAMIIYQKMMLKSLEEDCTMKFEGLEDTFEEEIAVDIVEDEPEKVELIKQIIDFLIKHELMIKQENDSFFFPQAQRMSGGESSSAERMRRKRERDKEKASQCGGTASLVTSKCDKDASHCEVIITETDTETDLHLNSDKSKSLDVESKTNTEQANADSASIDRQTAAAAAECAAPPAGDLFSVDQLKALVKKNKVNLTEEGVQAFHEEMQGTGWILYNDPVEKKFIVRALRAWAKYHSEYGPEIKNSADSESESEKKPRKKQQESREDRIERELHEVASDYISKRLFDENPSGHHMLMGKYVPKECFTQEQLEYLVSRWGVWPKSERFVLVDEYLEDEED